MSEVISVRFRSGCKNYYFDPCGLQVKMGQPVIVETAQGAEYATCTEGNHEVAESAVVRPLSPVLRLATEADRRTVEYHKRRESDAFDIAEKKIADHGLEMKLVSVSSSFEGNKIVFYFTADGRVDFRALVRDLAAVFRSRIELRQIGVRDEARMIGGLGICGRPFCCSQFLNSFLPVSIKMAKTQNLSLNPAKISGACGRLMCCLKYEQNAYEDAARRLPRLESFVQTPDGPGSVKAVDLLRETVRVSLDSEPESQKTYRCSEIIVLRNGKGSREGIELPSRPARYVEEKQEERFEPVFSENFEPFGDFPSPKRELAVPPLSGQWEDDAQTGTRQERRRNRNNVRRNKAVREEEKFSGGPQKRETQKKDYPKREAGKQDYSKKGFQKDRDFQKREEDTKRRGNRNYYRGGRRNRGGRPQQG